MTGAASLMTPQTSGVVAILGLGLAAATVGVYWVYTLLEVDSLRRFVTPVPRVLAFGVAFGAAWLAQSAAMLAWMNAPQPKPPPDVLGFGAILGVALLAMYAWRRQWLVPRPATPLSAVNATLSDDEPMAVLAGGEAIPVRWLNLIRTGRWHNTLLVHCGLSRSLAAFSAPRSATMAAFLPTHTGFAIGDARQLWDGVDGAAIGKAPALPRKNIALMTAADWRRSHPDGVVVGPVPLPPSRPMLSPATRSSRGVEDGMRWGIVRGDSWSPLDDHLRAEQAAESGPERAYYLARWAAIARGLTIASTGSS